MCVEKSECLLCTEIIERIYYKLKTQAASDYLEVKLWEGAFHAFEWDAMSIFILKQMKNKI